MHWKLMWWIYSPTIILLIVQEKPFIQKHTHRTNSCMGRNWTKWTNVTTFPLSFLYRYNLKGNLKSHLKCGPTKQFSFTCSICLLREVHHNRQARFQHLNVIPAPDVIKPKVGAMENPDQISELDYLFCGGFSTVLSINHRSDLYCPTELPHVSLLIRLTRQEMTI